MSLRSVPQNGQTNWGTALNNHLGQLMDPTYGGFRIVADTDDRNSKFSGLTQENEGLTVFNREIGKFQVFTATPFGTAWQDLPQEMRPEQITGVGQVVQDNNGMLSVTGASGANLQQLGIGFGTTIYANGKSGVVTVIDGQKFRAGLLGDVQEISRSISMTAGSNVITGDFSGLDIQVGDHFRPLPWSIINGYITDITSSSITIGGSTFGSSNTANYSSFRITKKLPATNYTFAKPSLSLQSTEGEGIFTVSDEGATRMKSFRVEEESVVNDILRISNTYSGSENLVIFSAFAATTYNNSNNKINLLISSGSRFGNNSLTANPETDAAYGFYSHFDYLKGSANAYYSFFARADSVSDNPLYDGVVTKGYGMYEALNRETVEGTGNYFRNKIGIGVGASSPEQIKESLHVNGGNIRLSRTTGSQHEGQYLNIGNTGSSGGILESRSLVVAGKPFIIDISTNDDHTPPTADSCDFVVRNLGQQTFRISQNGNATLAGTLTENSDISLKKDISSLEKSLEVVTQLNPVNYKWKEGSNREEGKQIGFIAQEVEKVLPEVVSTDEKGIKSVAYSKMVAVLTGAIQEQQAMIEEMKAEIEELKKNR